MPDFTEAWSTSGATSSRSFRTQRLPIWPMLHEECRADEIAALSSSLAVNVISGSWKGGEASPGPSFNGKFCIGETVRSFSQEVHYT